jgi:hypothetical protein
MIANIAFAIVLERVALLETLEALRLDEFGASFLLPGR